MTRFLSELTPHPVKWSRNNVSATLLSVLPLFSVLLSRRRKQSPPVPITTTLSSRSRFPFPDVPMIVWPALLLPALFALPCSYQVSLLHLPPSPLFISGNVPTCHLSKGASQLLSQWPARLTGNPMLLCLAIKAKHSSRINGAAEGVLAGD